MTIDVFWGSIVLVLMFLAGLATRRFAGAVRMAGGRLLTDSERRQMTFERPVASLADILLDSVAVFRQLLTHQRDRKAEAWRLLAWALLLISGCAIAFGRRAASLVLDGTGPKVALRDVGLLGALAILIFWGLQLILALQQPRSRNWLVVCMVSVAAAAILATYFGWLGNMGG